MAWEEMSGGELDEVDEAFLAADAAEQRSVMAYTRLRPLVALVTEAMRRAESAARLEAALRLTCWEPAIR